MNPISPVRSHIRLSHSLRVSAVSSGWFKYSIITWGPQQQISPEYSSPYFEPGNPSAIIPLLKSSPSKIAQSVPVNGIPIVPIGLSPNKLPALTTGLASERPYPSTILPPVFFSNASATGPCKGPAPETHNLNLPVISNSLISGKSARRLNKISAPVYKKPFGAGKSWIVSSNSSVGGGLGNSIIQPPSAIHAFITVVIANEWNNGKTPTSPIPGSSPPNHEIHCLALDTKLKWVNTVAFGTPVVPPVIMYVAGRSTGSISTSGRFGSVFNRSNNL